MAGETLRRLIYLGWCWEDGCQLTSQHLLLSLGTYAHFPVILIQISSGFIRRILARVFLLSVNLIPIFFKQSNSWSPLLPWWQLQLLLSFYVT